jgi:hypothetical protein
MRSIIVTLVVVAAAVSGCGGPSEPAASNVVATVDSTAPSTTAATNSTTSTAAKPSATKPPATNAAADGACAASDMASVEMASRCLISAVLAGDRTAAGRFATPDTVAKAFKQKTAFAKLKFDSCVPPQRGEAQCSFTAGSQTIVFVGADVSTGGDGRPSGFTIVDVY